MEAKLAPSIPYLPLHIVEEILNRVDVQTLSQSSLFVCRDWNRLITNPDFLFRSSSFGSTNQILLIKACSQNYESEYIHFSGCRVTYSVHWDNHQFDLSHKIENDIDDFEYTRVIGVSNGLICLASTMLYKFILWNPAIRKYVWLPPMMKNWYLSSSSVGFGFDYSSNDFKIVIIITYLSNNWIDEVDSVWVFSYTTWSWKRLTYGSILHSCHIHRAKPNVYFNGIIHWFAHNNEINHDVILTFDLSREIFGQILLPKDARRHFCWYSFVATTGDLLLFTQWYLENEYAQWYLENEYDEDLEYEYGEDGFCDYRFNTWTMKQYGNHESWTKTSSLKMKKTMGPEYVLGARKNGDLILEREEGQIYRYNPASPTDVLLVGTMENSVFFHYHTESLYLLEKDDEVDSY